MLDWWQALAISATTVLATGFVAYLLMRAQHRWLSSAARDADTRDREAEERQARRDYRREQVQPILSLVTLFQEVYGKATVQERLVKSQEWIQAVEGEAGVPAEKVAGWLRETINREKDGPSRDLALYVFREALLAADACPSSEIADAIDSAFLEATNPGTNPEAFRNLQKAVEDYIVRAE